jgi:methylated-DNA-[protein]-cysteine S-methyltransferase
MASASPITVPTHATMFATELGTWGLAWSSAGIVRLQLPDRDAADTRARLTRGLIQVAWTQPNDVPAVAALQAYARGDAIPLDDLPVDLAAVPAFHRTVYAALRQIPRGQTTTYGALAAAVGAPGAAQAVGQAMGRNPVPVIVPCHRVLASGNKMGGFSAPGGVATKDQLLLLEGVAVEIGTPLLPGLFADRPE